MKWVLLISIFVSCSSYKLTTKEKVEKRWSLLERAIDDNWTQKKIQEVFGAPRSKRINKKDESWFYHSPESGVQEWWVRFDLDKKNIIGLGCAPTGSMYSEFTIDKILKRWSKLNCQKKKSKWYTKGHTVYQDRYYLCDGNKRVDYNRYNEVSWIRVKR